MSDYKDPDSRHKSLMTFKRYMKQYKKSQDIEKSGFFLNKDGTVSIAHDTSNHRSNARKKKKLKEGILDKVKSAVGIKADHEKTLDDHAAEHNKEDHHKYLTKHSANAHKDPHEAKAIKHFKDSSMNINHTLIKDHKEGRSGEFTYDRYSAKMHKQRGREHDEDDWRSESNVHHTILKHAKPLGKKMTLYHGSEHDFGEAAKSSKKGIIHSPAHLSTSHDHNVSKGFGKHVIAIHADEKTKGVYLDGHGDHDKKSEKETVIPAGTKLKHIKSHKTSDGYTVHHFKVHSQEDHEPYDKD